MQRLEDLPPEDGDAPQQQQQPQSPVKDAGVDAPRQRFPYSLVWGPLPVITWLLPFIGHMGLCDSEGRVHDFAGPYFVGIDRFMTGTVHKYYQFRDAAASPRQWDEALARADGDYREMMHNLFCNNCHHHSARALTYFGVPSSQWSAWWLIQTRGRYVSWGHLLSVYLPFLVIVAIVATLVTLA